MRKKHMHTSLEILSQFERNLYVLIGFQDVNTWCFMFFFVFFWHQQKKTELSLHEGEEPSKRNQAPKGTRKHKLSTVATINGTSES